MNFVSNLLTQDDFNYGFDATLCSKCEGNCCIGEQGYIWITSKEMQRLSQLLNISTDELKHQHLRKINYKYSIKEKQLSKDNFACVFFDLDKKQCSVYDARPTQCRTFPFWEYFKENEKEVYDECPAIKAI